MGTLAWEWYQRSRTAQPGTARPGREDSDSFQDSDLTLGGGGCQRLPPVLSRLLSERQERPAGRGCRKAKMKQGRWRAGRDPTRTSKPSSGLCAAEGSGVSVLGSPVVHSRAEHEPRPRCLWSRRRTQVEGAGGGLPQPRATEAGHWPATTQEPPEAVAPLPPSSPPQVRSLVTQQTHARRQTPGGPGSSSTGPGEGFQPTRVHLVSHRPPSSSATLALQTVTSVLSRASVLHSCLPHTFRHRPSHG